MDTQKRKFLETQILIHNETKIHDYLKEIVESKEYFFESFLQPNQNNEFLELGLNSFFNSRTKKQYSELFKKE